jgi:hypothetical protein
MLVLCQSTRFFVGHSVDLKRCHDLRSTLGSTWYLALYRRPGLCSRQLTGMKRKGCAAGIRIRDTKLCRELETCQDEAHNGISASYLVRQLFCRTEEARFRAVA